MPGLFQIFTNQDREKSRDYGQIVRGQRSMYLVKGYDVTDDVINWKYGGHVVWGGKLLTSRRKKGIEGSDQKREDIS